MPLLCGHWPVSRQARLGEQVGAAEHRLRLGGRACGPTRSPQVPLLGPHRVLREALPRVDGLLQHALWQGLREQENLTILQPAQCAELRIDDEAAHLKLKDGHELRARLIVGADGRDSWVRNQTIMPEVPTPYFQHGVVANFETGKAHRGIAWQWFTPDGILALLPLRANATCKTPSAMDAVALPVSRPPGNGTVR